MAVRRNHEHSHHCKTSRLSLPSPLSLSLALPRVSSRSISLRKYPWRPASACTSLPQAGSLAIAGERSKGSPVEARIAESVEGWLRGLDSNQDIQLQRLACYRLHHPGPGHVVVTSLLETCHRATVFTRTSTIKVRLSAFACREQVAPRILTNP